MPAGDGGVRRGTDQGQLVLLLVCVDALAATWCTTQYLAHRLDFRAELGAWLFAPSPSVVRWLQTGAVIVAGCGVALALVTRTRVPSGPGVSRAIILLAIVTSGATLVASLGPVYAPQRSVTWLLKARRSPAGEALRADAVRVFGAVFLSLFAGSMTLLPRRGTRHPSDSHGSAEWGRGEGLEAPTGLELGRLNGRILRYDGDGHVLTVAPTRTGKGIGAVIPNLLHYPGSVVVTDPKGENYAVSARRRRELGTTVHALDPFGVVGGLASFNPLDLVDVETPDANDDAWMIADMLVVSDGRAADEGFWNEEARALLAGLILHVAASAPPELRTLSHVRSLLTLPPEQLQRTLTEMLESEAVDGLVARSAARLLQKADRERSGVISSAQSHTHFLDSPRMQRVLGSSSLALSDLKHSRVSLFLVLPPDRMDTYRGWMRVMTSCCLLAITRVPGPPVGRVLFLLDEFANLGRMRPVQRAISLAAAYGASFWLLLQDLAQLKGTYPEQWQTFVANADVLQTFGNNDWETAEYFSKMTGERTIHVESENESTGVTSGRNTSRQESSARTVAEKGRRLLLPDEVRRMDRSVELLFVRGRRPVMAGRLDYLADPEYVGMGDPNPMHCMLRRA